MYVPSNGAKGTIAIKKENEISLPKRPVEWIVWIIGRLRNKNHVCILSACSFEEKTMALKSLFCFQQCSARYVLPFIVYFEDSKRHIEKGEVANQTICESFKIIECCPLSGELENKCLTCLAFYSHSYQVQRTFPGIPHVETPEARMRLDRKSVV